MAEIDLTQFEGHTPGPWWCHGQVWIEGGGATLADLAGASKADAALMTAAPMLLAEVRRQAAEIERLKAAQSMSPASAAHGEIALRWRVQADGLYAVDMLVSNLDTEAQAHAAMAYVHRLFAGKEIAGKH